MFPAPLPVPVKVPRGKPAESVTSTVTVQELNLPEGRYPARDVVLLNPIAPHPSFQLQQSASVLDITPRPFTAGLRLSGFQPPAVKTTPSIFADATEAVSKPKTPPSNGSKKKKQPKSSLRKTNSTFISKFTTHDVLSKHLDSIDINRETAFVNNHRGLLWYHFSVPGQPEQLMKILFTKAHPLCHDINAITRASAQLDLIVGFSTSDIVWYEPISQRYSHINKNGVINASAITGIQWLPGSESLFVASHSDGSIVVYDKERDDAPVSWEEEFRIPTPASQKGTRQPRLLVRKSIGSPNQKTNPVAVYKTSRRQLTDLKCSADGRFVAVTSEDGTLRVMDLLRETLIDLYASYFGGLTCVAWSPDGRYIITGGQDDFVSLWSFEDRSIVARCEGHRSWVTALAFDSWRSDDEAYRFGSVDENGRLLLWDFSLGTMPKTPSIRPSIASTITRDVILKQEKSGPRGLDDYHESTSQESTEDVPVAHPIEPRARVAILPPVMAREVDEHPMAWVEFSQQYIAVSCNQGHIRTFDRPDEQVIETQNGTSKTI